MGDQLQTTKSLQPHSDYRIQCQQGLTSHHWRMCGENSFIAPEATDPENCKIGHRKVLIWLSKEKLWADS